MEYMFLPLKRYAEFSGRSRRMEYWLWTLFLFLLWMAFLVVIVAVAGAALMGGGTNPVASIMAMGGGILIIAALAFLVWLAFLIPTLAVGVRRLHDTERSGWWLGGLILLDIVNAIVRSSMGGAVAMITSLALVVLAITLLVFYCLDGTKGPNKYGPDPKGGVNAEVFA
ncbi:MAG TPA: DUF805 domain-containing protein [Allosphingosinicella sp.]|jgi:uncharacterized membrane protein YhaH (DUF805 family)|nr:DUF805 domain-containing protein [Allosphingosinicella sp.]